MTRANRYTEFLTEHDVKSALARIKNANGKQKPPKKNIRRKTDAPLSPNEIEDASKSIAYRMQAELAKVTGSVADTPRQDRMRQQREKFQLKAEGLKNEEFEAIVKETVSLNYFLGMSDLEIAYVLWNFPQSEFHIGNPRLDSLLNYISVITKRLSQEAKPTDDASETDETDNTDDAGEGVK